MDRESTLKNLETLFEQKNYIEALNVTDKLLLQEPQCEDLHLYRALCLKELKNYDESFKSFDQSILMNPNKGITYAAKGNLLFDQGNHLQACHNYVRATEINAKINFYSEDNLSFIITEHENAIKHYEVASMKSGFSPDRVIKKRKSSLDTYEKLKQEHAFDSNI